MAKSQVLTFVGGRLIDGTGKPPVEKSIVVVEGPKITGVGEGGSVQIPTDAKVIDASGKTVMPGLIDCHVHLAGLSTDEKINFQLWNLKTPPAMKLLHAVVNAQRALDSGTTTLRNMARDENEVSLRDAFDKGVMVGPRIVTTAGGVGMTASHGDMFTPPIIPRKPGATADGPDECRKAVRERVRWGADFIKISTTGGVMSEGDESWWRNFTPAEIGAITDEAHALGRKVASHAQGTEGIKNAVRGGVDTIEHGCYLDDEAIQMMIDSGTILVPTLAIVYEIINRGEELGVPEYGMRKARLLFEAHVESVKNAYRKGAKIATGTDTSGRIVRFGNHAVELELLCKCGMSPMEAIVAATKTASEALGRQDKFGTLEAGKLADLIVVDGNPLEEIRVLQDKNRVRMVVKNGEIVVNRAA
ncbi:MAG: amidohydrolase family protein [Candidatus Bathyarchaeia archaeon]